MPPKSAYPRIFISYARSDGGRAATNLRLRLQKEGFEVWQDVVDMEGGRDWWRQISQAIDNIEHLILLMTPGALESEVVHEEWRYARRKGRCVIPIKAANLETAKDLPSWMRRAHFVDSTQNEQWRRLVRTLEGPCVAPNVPFMIQDLPETFVARPKETEQIIASLVSDSNLSSSHIVCIRGAGGCGKTTLARAICYDPRIQDEFHDGTVWATLGEQPSNLMGHMVDVLNAITGENRAVHSIDAAIHQLKEVIADRRILIVLDDVWDIADARPLLQGGDYCGWLITTRRADTTPESASTILLGAMQESEAARLLRPDAAPEHKAELRNISKCMGDWPLLLKLAGAMLRERERLGEPLQEAIQWVKKSLTISGVSAFDSVSPRSRDQAIATALDGSIKQLDPEDIGRFSDVAIFVEDAEIPITALALLWDQGEFESETLCRRVYQLGLFWNLDLASRTVRMHDVIRAYLLQPEIDTRVLHAKLLDAYKKTCPDGWHSIQDDGYIYKNLIFHLYQAGYIEELIAILFEYRWIQAKANKLGINAVIDDFDRFPAHPDTSIVSEALKLSSHVTSENIKQLPIQILGRLEEKDGKMVANLINSTRKFAARPNLLPVNPTLHRPLTGLRRIIRDHRSIINDIAVSPDGRYLAAAYNDGTLVVWDPQSGKNITELRGHTNRVLAVQFIPSGEKIVSASADHTIRIWRLSDGACEARLGGHSAPVTSIDTTKNGQLLVSGANDHTVRIWDLTKYQPLASWIAHIGLVTAVALTDSGDFVISASNDYTVKIWRTPPKCNTARTASGSLTRPFKSQTIINWLRDRFNWYCRGLIGSSYFQLIREIKESAWTESMILGPEDQKIVTGGKDGTIKIWNKENGLLESTVSHTKSSVISLAIDKLAKCIISGAEDGNFSITPVAKDNFPSVITRRSSPITGIAISEGRSVFATASRSGIVRLWDSNTLNKIREEKKQPFKTIGGTAIQKYDKKNINILSIEINKKGEWSFRYQGLAKFSSDKRRLLLSNNDKIMYWRLSEPSSFDDNSLFNFDHKTNSHMRYGRIEFVRREDELILERRSHFNLSDPSSWSIGEFKLLGQKQTSVFQARDDRIFVFKFPQNIQYVASFDKGENDWKLMEVVHDESLGDVDGLIRRIALSKSERFAAFLSFSMPLRVWDLTSGNIIGAFDNDWEIVDCTFGDDDQMLRVRDVTQCEHLLKITP